MAKIDSDGYVHIVGRQKDLIISGGLNIYPKEIESVLDEVPGVVESAVIGLPHPDFGETVVAVVVAKEGFSIEDLRSSVGEKLARFKHPRHYEIVSDLPRNAMGKVQKAELRSRYATVLSSS